MSRCDIKGCPEHGRCADELTTAEICPVYRCNQPIARNRFKSMAGHGAARAREKDRKEPIVEEWRVRFIDEAEKRAKKLPEFMRDSYLDRMYREVAR